MEFTNNFLKIYYFIKIDRILAQIILLLFIFFNNIAICQDTTDCNCTSTDVIIESNNYFESNAIKNRMINKMIFGGFIDDFDKKLFRNKSKIKFGYEINNKLTIMLNNDSNSYNKLRKSFIFIGSNRLLSTSMDKNIFDFIFYGNKNLISSSSGDIISVGNINFMSYNYDKIGFGFYFPNNSSKISTSLIIANQYRKLMINNLSFRDFDFEQDYFINLNYKNTGKIDKNYLTFNGIGLAINFEKSINHINISIEDFGFVYWKKHELRKTKFEDNFIFDGILIDNLNFDSIIIVDTLLTTINNFGNQSTQKFSFLPFEINLSNKYKLSCFWNIFYGVKYKNFANYFPLMYLGIDYNELDYHFMPYFSYGGYANSKIGFKLQYYSKKINYFIDINNILYNFTPNGNGSYINFGLNIKNL